MLTSALLTLLMVSLLVPLSLPLFTTQHGPAGVGIALPIFLALAEEIGLEALSTVYIVMVAGSIAFILPISYQTHLMVQQAASYRNLDFIKLGVPLTLLCILIGVNAVLPS